MNIRADIWLIPFLMVSIHANAQFTEQSATLGISNYSDDFLSGGVALLDFNNDGYEDVYVVGGNRGDKLYENTGRNSFIDVTGAMGLDKLPNVKIMGVLCADLDNDGYTDILLTTESGKRCYLLWNKEGLVFEETGLSSGNDFLQKFYGSSAAAGDFDMDGDLDLYICNYDIGGRDFLFENNGDRTFSDRSDLIGTDAEGTALTVVFSDFDMDGDMDIMVGNDFGYEILPNKLFRNDYPEKKFTEVSATNEWDIGINSMGIAIADFNNDLDLDYYVTDIGGNHFFTSSGAGLKEVTQDHLTIELENVTSWGTLFIDYDNDGIEDLFVANGQLGVDENREQRNALFKVSGGSFTDVSSSQKVDSPLISRGVASGDYNNDGAPDILVGLVSENPEAGGEGPLLYANSNKDNNWVKLDLVGISSNRDATGAKVYVSYGDRTIFREVYGGGSYLSSSSKTMIVGIGQESMVSHLEIRWPSGAVDRYEDLSANEHYLFIEGKESYILNFESILSCKGEGTIINGREVYEEGIYSDTLNNPGSKEILVTKLDVDNSCVISSTEKVLSKGFEVYPNPFYDKLIIENREDVVMDVKLFNIPGQNLYLNKNAIGDKIIFDTSHLNNGAYMLYMKGRKYSKNIIVIKK